MGGYDAAAVGDIPALLDRLEALGVYRDAEPDTIPATKAEATATRCLYADIAKRQYMADEEDLYDGELICLTPEMYRRIRESGLFSTKGLPMDVSAGAHEC